MKTRSGENVPLARTCSRKQCERARKIIDEKNPDLSEAEKSDVAQKIGIGAVKYADLSQYRMTDYVFSWEKMLSSPGKYGSLFAKRICANSLDFPESRRISCSHAPAAR